jgi:hypothetical protein
LEARSLEGGRLSRVPPSKLPPSRVTFSKLTPSRVPSSRLPPSRSPSFEAASFEAGSFEAASFEVASLSLSLYLSLCLLIWSGGLILGLTETVNILIIKTISVNPFVHKSGRPYKAQIPY